MGGVRARDEHPGRKAHRVSACSHETSLPSAGHRGHVYVSEPRAKAGETGCAGRTSLEAGPKSHATTAEGGSPREAEAQLPEEGAVWRADTGRAR